MNINVISRRRRRISQSEYDASLKSRGSRSSRNHFSRRRLVATRSFQDKFLLYTGEKLHWVQVFSRLGGTVIHAVLPWAILCGIYGTTISLLYQLGYLGILEQIKALPHVVVVLNVGLSLLLVFRTNAAHERFWEARKLWGAMVNTVRNLARGIWIIIDEQEPGDQSQKESAMRLVSAFSVAMKLHLRRDPMSLNDELAPLMSSLQYERIRQVNHGPLELAFWIGDYLQYQYECDRLSVFQLQDLHKLLNDMVDILGGCERILKTPVPLIYTITLKFLFVAFFILVPLEVVESLHWWTAPVSVFLSLIFLSIHEIGSEIEEPFGHDPNDLPLDFICNTIKRNVADLIQDAPASRHVVEWPTAAR